MTSHVEDIYIRNRNAGFNRRLDIYLQFPDLRNEFLEIDLKEKKTINTGNAIASKFFSRLRMPAGLLSFGEKVLKS